MSIKRMATKLALAYAASKGVEAFKNMGGLSGLKAAMQGGGSNAANRHDTSHAGSSGGLGGILDALGARSSGQQGSGGHGHQGTGQNPSLGTLFGTLAGFINGQSDPQAAARDLDQQFEMQDAQTDEEAKPILRAMVQMARVDGHVDAEEEATLLDILDDASDHERAMLKEAMREPISAAAIAADTPHKARKEVYSAALLVGTPDHPQETSFLRDLAQHLGLQQSEVEALHRAMGKPVIAVA